MEGETAPKRQKFTVELPPGMDVPHDSDGSHEGSLENDESDAGTENALREKALKQQLLVKFAKKDKKE